jgi:hypothetical protein
MVKPVVHISGSTRRSAPSRAAIAASSSILWSEAAVPCHPVSYSPSATFILAVGVPVFIPRILARMSGKVKEFSFRVSGAFRNSSTFDAEFLVYATSLEEARQQLDLCLGTFDEVTTSTIGEVTESDADDYGTEQYEEGGAFTVFDPRFTGQSGDA